MTTPAADALAELLAVRPDAVVAALGPEARLVPLPDGLPLRGHRHFARRSGLDLFFVDDVVGVLDAWARAQREPVAVVEARLQVQPEHAATVHLFDVREEHGVHVVVLELPDPDLVLDPGVGADARGLGVGRVTRDAMAVFVDVDETACAVLGWPRDDLVGRPTIELVHPGDIDRAVASWMRVREGNVTGRAQVRLRRPDGRFAWIEVRHEEGIGADGLIRSEVVDISEQMAALEAMHERERQLHHLAAALPVGICHVRPDGAVAYTNAPLVELLGDVSTVDDLVAAVERDDQPLVAFGVERALAGEPVELEVGVAEGEGKRRCELTMRAMPDGAEGVIVCAADVTERSRLRAELEHRANHDALTGCLNRGAVVRSLGQLLASSTAVAVAFIDLDDFKAVNDGFGHAAGDELLRTAANRLRASIRADDVLGRIGGDEFVVLCPRGREQLAPEALAARLSDALRDEVVVRGRPVPMRVSIGVAVSETGEVDAEALLGRADDAMYAVKRRGRQVQAS